MEQALGLYLEAARPGLRWLGALAPMRWRSASQVRKLHRRTWQRRVDTQNGCPAARAAQVGPLTHHPPPMKRMTHPPSLPGAAGR